ncbi:MAG: NupC/NupG family nucleoside CNT transporter [Cyanobacteria bacterium P01_A01_bin.116]
MERLISLLGIVVFVAIAYGLSSNRQAIRWKPVVGGLALQFLLALFILRTQMGLALFSWLGDLIVQFFAYSDAGSIFVFGENFRDFFFAFKVLPSIIFFSAFINILYHYGVLQQAVKVMAWLMMRMLGTSGVESLSAAANVFVSQTEAPLVIKPYVKLLTRSELNAVMVGGFASVSGWLLPAFVSFGVSAEHLITASVMSAPAGLAIAKILCPETVTINRNPVEVVHRRATNVIDAVATGALEGVKIAVGIAAMVIAFLGLLTAVNGLLGWAGGWVGLPQLSLELMLSYLLAPMAWLMGIAWSDCNQVAVLLGKKVILNEFIAYSSLQQLIDGMSVIPGQSQVAVEVSQRSLTIATYALCGFANLGSIGIQIGGLSALAPERQSELAELGLRAMIGGVLASFMTAAIAGFLL